MGNRQKGIWCIVASAFGFALMALCVRLCDDYGGPVSSFQKAFFRNAIAVVIAFALFIRAMRPADGTARLPQTMRAWSLLLLRALAGGLGIFCNFYALSNIPIGEAMTLNKTAPFFTVLFAWLFLRERANARQLLCLVLAFLGALLVMKPGWRLSGTFASFCGLLGGLGAGIAYTCLRELARLGVNGSFIVFFFSLFSMLLAVPLVFLSGGAAPMTCAQTVILVGAGCGAAIGQFGVTAAYRFAAPRDVAVFDYTNIVFTAILGFVFFAQIPDLFSVAGFALILGSAILQRQASLRQDVLNHD